MNGIVSTMFSLHAGAVSTPMSGRTALQLVLHMRRCWSSSPGSAIHQQLHTIDRGHSGVSCACSLMRERIVCSMVVFVALNLMT